MGIQTVLSDVQNVLAGANLDVRPPATGYDWEITDIGSSVWVGGAPNSRPQVDIGYYDGLIGPSYVLRSTDVRGWFRPQRLSINRNNYLRFNNPGIAAENVSYSAKITRYYGTGLSGCISDLQTLIAGATYSVQPPAGYDYKVKDIGSDQWVGGAPAGLPNVRVDLTDGIFTAIILQGTDVRQWEDELEIFVNNTNYINIVNTAAVQGVISFSADLHRYYGAGMSTVISDLQNCGAGASVDFQPANGVEWRITGFAAANWVGVPPLQFPDVTINLYDGTIASSLALQTDWKEQGHQMDIVVSDTDYIRITDTSGAGGDVGIIGELHQVFAS